MPDQIDGTPLPPPMVPADCNLRDFEFMPVVVGRLLKSETWSLGTGEERAGAVALWFESWHQVPAGSLPGDERLQKKLADSDSWRKIKQQALRGWIACSDGRLYHPVVAEKALEAWIEKLLSAAAGSVTNLKRWGVAFDRSSMLEQLQDSIRRLRLLNPQSKTLRKKGVIAALAGKLPGESPPDPAYLSPPDPESGSPPDPGSDRPPMSPPDPKTIATDRDRDRELLNTNTTEPTALSPSACSAAGMLNGKLNGHHSPDPAQQPLLPGGDPPPDLPPPCPHQALLALYAKQLPHLPQPRLWEGARAEAMRARWRQCSRPTAFGKGYRTMAEGLAFWEKLFAFVASCPPLRDGIPRGNGSAWVPDLPWIVKAENFAKIIEGKYAQ